MRDVNKVVVDQITKAATLAGESVREGRGRWLEVSREGRRGAVSRHYTTNKGQPHKSK